MKRFGLISIVLVAGFFLSACGGGGFGDIATRAIYPFESVNRTQVPENPPAPLQQQYLSVTVGTETLRIHVWYFTQADATKPVVIYFHGNGENLATMQRAGTFEKIASDFGTHVVGFDYPAYGRSTGLPNQATILAAASATLAWTKQNFANSPIHLWGWSLGAAVASQVASSPDVKKFALTSAWSSLKELANELFGGLVGLVPKEFFDANVWDSTIAASTITAAGIMHHGTNDKTIPIKFGQKVYSFHDQSRVTFHPLDGRGHNDVFLEAKLWEDLSQFLGH